jgi:hypothetical protein
MRARVFGYAFAAVALVAGGCATHNDGYYAKSPGDRTFANESPTPTPQPVAPAQPVVVATGQPVVVPAGQPVVVPAGQPVVVPAGQPVVVPAGQTLVVQPGQSIVLAPGQPATVVTGAPGASGPVIQAEDLEATEVRARTIYANKIESPMIQGAIYQTGGVKFSGSVADIKGPTFTASVIYADTIKADRVFADQIFVREVKRR